MQETLDFLIDQYHHNKEAPSHAKRKEIFNIISKNEGNNKCFECNQSSPSWLSMTYGIFLCITCSGIHRSAGTHLSFVRSAHMDTLAWDQIIRIAVGGNRRCREFLNARSHNVLDLKSTTARDYKHHLDNSLSKAIGLDHATKKAIKHTILGSNDVDSTSGQTPSIPASEKNFTSFHQPLAMKNASKNKESVVKPVIFDINANTDSSPQKSHAAIEVKDNKGNNSDFDFDSDDCKDGPATAPTPQVSTNTLVGRPSISSGQNTSKLITDNFQYGSGRDFSGQKPQPSYGGRSLGSESYTSAGQQIAPPGNMNYSAATGYNPNKTTNVNCQYSSIGSDGYVPDHNAPQFTPDPNRYSNNTAADQLLEIVEKNLSTASENARDAVASARLDAEDYMKKGLTWASNFLGDRKVLRFTKP